MHRVSRGTTSVGKELVDSLCCISVHGRRDMAVVPKVRATVLCPGSFWTARGCSLLQEDRRGHDGRSSRPRLRERGAGLPSAGGTDGVAGALQPPAGDPAGDELDPCRAAHGAAAADGGRGATDWGRIRRSLLLEISAQFEPDGGSGGRHPQQRRAELWGGSRRWWRHRHQREPGDRSPTVWGSWMRLTSLISGRRPPGSICSRRKSS